MAAGEPECWRRRSPHDRRSGRVGPRRVARGMVGDSHMHDASTFVGENHQDEQQPAGRRWYDEEIGGGDLCEMIRQECAPVRLEFPILSRNPGLTLRGA